MMAPSMAPPPAPAPPPPVGMATPMSHPGRMSQSAVGKSGGQLPYKHVCCKAVIQSSLLQLPWQLYCTQSCYA